VVLKIVKINVARVGEHVSKRNMSRRGEDEADGTQMIQQLFEGPLEREDTRAFDEHVLSNLKRSLMTKDAIFGCPYLLQPSPCMYSTGESELNQHGYLPWPRIMPKLIEGSDNMFCFHSFLVQESSDDRLHPFTPCDGLISNVRSILVEGN
jgi:hypothetical protein